VPGDRSQLLERTPVVRPRWQEMNLGAHEAAARHRIPVVPAYKEFSGPVGARDPVTAGDALHQTGLSVGGVARLPRARTFRI